MKINVTNLKMINNFFVGLYQQHLEMGAGAAVGPGDGVETEIGGGGACEQLNVPFLDLGCTLL